MQTENRGDRRQYDTVIFDLDGTLLNTLEDLRDGVNHVLQEYNYPLRSLEEIRTFVGNGIQRLMRRALPDNIEEEQFQQAFLSYKSYYTTHCNIKTRPYKGIIPLLAALKEQGVLTAIVSNKNDAAVKELASEYFGDFIQIALGQREGVRTKPAPDAVYEVLKELEADAERTLYVGDSEVDQATADNAHMDCVLVDWGFRHRNDLLQLHPKRVISKPEELLELLV